MRTPALAPLALCLAAPLAIPAQEQTQPSEVPKVFVVGKPVDLELTLRDIRGRTHRLGDYVGRDKLLVVDFWSYSCPYSTAWETRLGDVAEAYEKRGVTVLAINSNATEVDPGAQDPYTRIRKYVEKAKIEYPILIDAKAAVAERFGAETTPHAFVIDAKGVLRYSGAIDNDGDFRRRLPPDEVVPYLANAIDALLEGVEVPTPETKAVGCKIKRESGS